MKRVKMIKMKTEYCKMVTIVLNCLLGLVKIPTGTNGSTMMLRGAIRSKKAP